MSKLTARLPLIAAFLVMFASFTVAQDSDTRRRETAGREGQARSQSRCFT